MSKRRSILFTAKVANSIRRHGILRDKRVIVALSGGADSVALLKALLSLGYECQAAHCNFRLRGEESDRDENFVRRLCKKLGVSLHTKAFDTAQYAKDKRISIEMAARDLRYTYFEELRRELGFGSIAVAHHRDDNAETILLNLIRGTGLKGLVGMAYERDHIMRPMLDVSRQEIIDYLREEGLTYVADSSNLVADVKRNIVRLRLMPILREMNPSIEETLTANARRLKEVYDTLRLHENPQWQESAEGIMTVRKDQILSHLALYDLLDGYGFTPAQTDSVWEGIDGTPGAVFESKTHRLLRDRDTLILCPREAEPAFADMPLEISYADISEFGSLPKTPEVACLDADKVGNNIIVRPTEAGDRFVPLGMKGSKLVSDFLTDSKADLFTKQKQLVMTNDRDIVWLINRRIDDRYKVVEGETKRILICKIKKQQI